MRYAIIITFLVATSLAGQVTSTITGTVQVEDGTPLPGVTITVTGPNLLGTRTVVTDEQGNFRVTVPPGDYRVTAALEGLQTITRNTSVGLGQASALTIRMRGAVTETVTVTADNRPPFTIVRVYYGTNRQCTTSKSTNYDYNGEQVGMSFGTATVSIPRDHHLGDWEQPLPGMRARQDSDVMLLTVIPRTKGQFVTDLHAAAHGKDAFVFVHGYNTSFAEAVQRTALLAYDLEFNGVPITFTWPSRGAYLRYMSDEDAATASSKDLEDFLQLVANESGATRIHLIAHSMGNRVMLEALHSLQQQHAQPANLANLVIAAPDVNIVRFGQLMTTVRSLTRTTLYASTRDRALRTSKWFHTYRRAGQAGKDLFLMAGVDTIDVSRVDTGLIAHSYYAENKSVVSDLYNLINHGTPPPARPCLTPSYRGMLPFWVFNPCGG